MKIWFINALKIFDVNVCLVFTVGSVKLPPTYGALCSGRSVILAAGMPKVVPGLKFVFKIKYLEGRASPICRWVLFCR
ncbi:hypothetical protein, partial [Flavobacterium filum]|uniref:hypothetical protein n=1 Tax=Flavobacterium filum TaxID=370974 RepID=UPI0023F47546